MAFFEKIGGAITNGVNSTATKAKDMNDNSKVNSEITARKKELNSAYTEIGMLYVNAGVTDKVNGLKANALWLINRIDELEQIVNQNKGLKKCEACGEVIDNASVFCPFCGQKQTVVVNKCVKCRTVLDDGAVFCHHCGTKQPDKNAGASQPEPAAVIPEAVPVVAAVEEPVIEEMTAAEKEPVVEEAAVVEDIPKEEGISAVEEAAEAEETEKTEESIIPEFVPAEAIEVEDIKDDAAFETQTESKGDFVFCEECGAVVEAGSAFCTECGSKIGGAVNAAPVEAAYVFCTSCGNKEEAGSPFCSECGAKME